LKWSGLVRRRTLAKWLCERGAIQVNGQAGKAGRAIAVGDRVTLPRGHRRVTVEVLVLPEHGRPWRPADHIQNETCYRILSDEPTKEEELSGAARSDQL
jgi:ribosomal 50S subunit-recycling heat shock protein